MIPLNLPLMGGIHSVRNLNLPLMGGIHNPNPNPNLPLMGGIHGVRNTG